MMQPWFSPMFARLEFPYAIQEQSSQQVINKFLLQKRVSTNFLHTSFNKCLLQKRVIYAILCFFINKNTPSF